MFLLKRNRYCLTNYNQYYLKCWGKCILHHWIMNSWEKKWVVDSVPWPQLHTGFEDFWKLCLNLCSLKWLKPRRRCVISLIPLGLWQLYTELAASLINWKIFFLNTRKLSELRRVGSNLFHSGELICRNEENGNNATMNFLCCFGI